MFCVAGSGLAVSLLLAVMADRVVAARHLPHAADLALRRGARGGRRAVAVHVRPDDRHLSLRAARLGIDWNHLLNGTHAMMLVVMAAVWKQISYNFLFFLAGLQSIPKLADRGRGHRRRRAVARFWTIAFPLLSPTTFFLLVVNIVYAFFDTFAIVDATTAGGPGQATKILVYKVYKDGFKASTSAARRRSRWC